MWRSYRRWCARWFLAFTLDDLRLMLSISGILPADRWRSSLSNIGKTPGGHGFMATSPPETSAVNGARALPKLQALAGQLL